MKTYRTKSKWFAVTLALSVVVMITSMWSVKGLGAAEETEIFLAPIGVVAGQTARLTVAHRGKEPGPVIEWKFLDAQGKAFSGGQERQRIAPGELKSYDVNFDEVNAAKDRAGRFQLQPVIRALGGPDTKNLTLSVEIFDNATGKTTIFIPASVQKGFNPQPDPPAFQ